jgi:hypothetical protein
MPKNPLQNQDFKVGGWFYRLAGAVVFAQMSGDLKAESCYGLDTDSANYGMVFSQVPPWLVKRMRRVIVSVAKEWAGYVMANQAREITALRNRCKELEASHNRAMADLAKFNFGKSTQEKKS